MNTEYEEINIIDYIKIIYKNRYLIIAVIGIFLLLGMAIIISTTSKPQPLTSVKAVIDTGLWKPLPSSLSKTPTCTEIIALSYELAFIPYISYCQEIQSIIAHITSPLILKQIYEKAGYNPPFNETIGLKEQRGLVEIETTSADGEKALAIIQATADIMIPMLNESIQKIKPVYEARVKTKEKELTLYRNQLKVEEVVISKLSSNYNQTNAAILPWYIDRKQALEQQILTRENELLSTEPPAFQPFTYIKPYTLPPSNIETSAKKRLIMATPVSIILGFFIGIFIAFGREWWRNNRAQFKI